MTTRTAFLGVVAGALVLAGCEAETGVGNVGVTVRALGSCPGAAGVDPVQAIDRVRVVVTAVNPETGGLYNPIDDIFDVRSTVSVSGIPAGINNIVTVLGFAADQTTPGWYGRHRQVRIEQDATTRLDIVLASLDRFTCVTPPNTFTHRVFPTVTTLGDGTVLVTGGFTGVKVEGSTTTLEAASDLALLYDAAKGGPLEQLPTPMTEARAGHSAVFLPITEKDGVKSADGTPIGKAGIVLLVGGLRRMQLRSDGFGFDTADALNSYEIYDVATKTFHPALKDETGTPRQMRLKRAFPLVARLFDNSVFIAGGGQLPSDPSPDYRSAEIWAPWVAPAGGLQPFPDKNEPKMKRQHNGAAIVKLEDTASGLSRYLMVGGSEVAASADNPNVEIYTQSSQQEGGVSGVVSPLEAKGLPPLFFPAIAPLNGKRFLVVGGAGFKDGKFQAPTDSAWVLELGRDASGTRDTITVTPVASVAAGCGARYFHSATPSYEGTHAVVLGGFKDFTGPAAAPNCRFDPEPAALTAVTETQAFAGHRAELLPDDTVLVVGGMVNRAPFPEETGLVQVYAPPTLKLDPAAE